MNKIGEIFDRYFAILCDRHDEPRERPERYMIKCNVIDRETAWKR